MPDSGIKAAAEVIRAFQLVNKSSKGLPYAVFKFSKDATKVVIDRDEKYYKKELKYDELMKLMPENEPRFVAFEFPHIRKDTNMKNKLPILISWFPPTCALKYKFLVGSTFISLSDDLGAKKKIGGDCLGELTQEEVCKKFEFNIVPEDQQDDISANVVDIDQQVPLEEDD